MDKIKLLEEIAKLILNGGIIFEDIKIESNYINQYSIYQKDMKDWNKVSFYYKKEDK